MSRKVLAVDDSRTMRDMVSFTLREAGFAVVEAEDGLAAIEALKTETVDLVITDVNMPRMDGLTFLKEFRADPAKKGVPVLILTTESDDSLRQKGRAAGATGWIVKPFEPEKLLQVVNKVCG